MHLLNTETFKVKEFYTDIPAYAILSHTWGRDEEEVIFQDIQDLEVAQGKAGWNKVAGICAYAKKYEFDWIWIDSCCINKQSSAELSEAINSMYSYYSNAAVCYVYLSDVPPGEDPRDPQSAFRHSKWFERGWTLQELLAPDYVVFLDNNWTEIGTRWSLHDAISAITTIPRRVFENGNIHDYSVAQRMSWAAWRETKRPEDQAYCLMGLFDVNLSPIYGEGGPKAFMRLQQEIIKNSNDRSIFAWVPHEENIEERGLLAITPYEFRASGDIQSSESLGYYSSFSFKFNNNGLHIFVSLTPTNSDLFLASLQCQSQLDGRHLYVYLKKTNLDAYKRCQPSQLLLASSSPQESLPSSTKEVSSSLSQGAIQEIVVWENLFLKRDKLDHKITLPPHKAQHCKLIRSWSGQISEPALQRTQISLSQTPVFVPVQHFTQNYKYATESGEHFWVVVQGIQRNVVVISELQEAYGRVEVLKFQVLTDATSPTVSEASDNPEILFKNSTQWSNASWIDRISAPLKSGKIATLSLHITGNAYNLEVSCFDKKLDSGLIEYPKLGFLVPTEIDSTNISSPFILRDVFPADYFQKKDGKKSYISMPDTGTHHNGQTEPGTFRVLFYESSLSYGHGSHKAFVAVGFHDGNLWTDTVTFQPYAEHPEAREIWNSYLDGGSRTQAQLDCQLSTSHNIMQSSTLLVSVGKRENLQLGTHFLHIEIKERQISTDVN